MSQTLWWWQNPEEYTIDTPVASEFYDYAGPKGIALVRAFDNGTTDTGWGADTFMEKYMKGAFSERRALIGYEKGFNHFAIVMRSVRLVCIDIDGKNGGIEHAAELLGNVPYTLAETSRSGNGFHLYFYYPDTWDPKAGYVGLRDAIGVVQGVDVRATGCVYHYATQRWNGKPVAPLPEWIAARLKKRQHSREATISQVVSIAKLGGDEALMQIQELLDDLAKDVPAGRRNNTLFAIGSKLMLAGYEEWEEVVSDRASELNLDFNQIAKLITSISKYGANSTE